MKRIMIIGNGGSGKSTLAVSLGNRLGLPVVHLDRIFWTPGWNPVSKEVFDSRLAEELQKESWIIDGNYRRTLPLRMESCDTVVWLKYSRWVCLWGVLTRRILNHGKTRPDMAPGCPEKIDWEFLSWIWNFDKVHVSLFKALLETYPEVKVVILKKRRETRKWLENMQPEKEEGR
jgi:adenylate kinase family enzyme